MKEFIVWIWHMSANDFIGLLLNLFGFWIVLMILKGMYRKLVKGEKK